MGSSEDLQDLQPELFPGAASAGSADSGAPGEVGFPRRGESPRSPRCQPSLPQASAGARPDAFIYLFAFE